MNDTELLELWGSYNKRLDENLMLNKRNAQEITKLQVRSALSSMLPVKIFAVVVGILWVGIIDVLVVRLFHVANIFFLVSAGIQAVLTQIAIGVYLYQLVLIGRVRVDEPVLATQEKLSQLRASTLWVARVLFLQLPLWTTFYWNSSMLLNGNIWLYILQVIVTGSFTYLAIWLFINIRYENRNKRWFRLIFTGKEWEPIISSMRLLSEISDYKK